MIATEVDTTETVHENDMIERIDITVTIAVTEMNAEDITTAMIEMIETMTEMIITIATTEMSTAPMEDMIAMIATILETEITDQVAGDMVTDTVVDTVEDMAEEDVVTGGTSMVVMEEGTITEVDAGMVDSVVEGEVVVEDEAVVVDVVDLAVRINMKFQ